MKYPTVVCLSGRSEIGISRPFFCDASDGNHYLVKRDNSTWDGLVKEFVIASLADKFGLPVAPFSLLEIPESLSRQVTVSDSFEFQPGVAIGSARIPFAEDLRESHLVQISEEEKIRCLCFDWWTRNHDRRINRLGGESNLLWDPMMESLYVIDFDQALDQDFDPEEFSREHAFREVIPFLRAATLKKLRTKFESAVYSLDKIWKKLPEEWMVNASGDSRLSFGLHEVETFLMKPDFPIEMLMEN